jgi:fused signal recognition particle receptor
MFKFLKEKLKQTISSISDQFKHEDKEEIATEKPEIQEKAQEIPNKKEISESTSEFAAPDGPIEESIEETGVEPELDEIPFDETPEQEIKEAIEEERTEDVEEVVEVERLNLETPEKEREKAEKIVEEASEQASPEMPQDIKEEMHVPTEIPKAEPKVFVETDVTNVTDVEEIVKEEIQEKDKKLGFFARLFGKKKGKTEPIEEILEPTEKPINKDNEVPHIVHEELKKLGKTKISVEEEPAKKGIFGAISDKITTTRIDEKQFEKLFWDLEVALLENNVAVEVIEKIKDNLKENIVEKSLKRSKIEEIITQALQNSLSDLFDVEGFDLLTQVKQKKPYVICFVGINGSGKTTTIAKIAHLLQSNNLKCVLVAGDTWRQAAIEQLESWANKLGANFVKQSYGSDPAAVAFDGIAMAKARNLDVVLIDTAGRMHSNTNLMDEMKKIIRVAKPDLKIFIGESITGNDCIEQAKRFDEAIGIDGIILSKTDVDEKGGAAISVSYVTKKPILYIGTGQNVDDLKPFSSEVVLKGLGLEA